MDAGTFIETVIDGDTEDVKRALREDPGLAAARDSYIGSTLLRAAAGEVRSPP